MDSGEAVPTLSRGVSTTVAMKVWVRARGILSADRPSASAIAACAALFWAMFGPNPYCAWLVSLDTTLA